MDCVQSSTTHNNDHFRLTRVRTTQSTKSLEEGAYQNHKRTIFFFCLVGGGGDIVCLTVLTIT